MQHNKQTLLESFVNQLTEGDVILAICSLETLLQKLHNIKIKKGEKTLFRKELNKCRKQFAKHAKEQNYLTN